MSNTSIKTVDFPLKSNLSSNDSLVGLWSNSSSTNTVLFKISTVLANCSNLEIRANTITAAGFFRTQQHTAPANSSLAAGDLAIWFDQTDGAAKVMFKAKTADGTLVTASVNLA